MHFHGIKFYSIFGMKTSYVQPNKTANMNSKTMERKITILTLFFMVLSYSIYGQIHNESDDKMNNIKAIKTCSSTCKAENRSGELACKLTTPELRERKGTVLKSLKAKIVEKKELGNGYAFKFTGTDEILDELTEFIKTERECCDFFVFNFSISGDKSEAWLELTGPEGSKDFIKSELGL